MSHNELPVITPRVDIYKQVQDEQEILVLADLPGAANEDLQVHLEPGRDGRAMLTIEAEAGLDKEGRKFKYQRAFSLDQEIDGDQIRAELRDGELRIHLPRAASRRTRQIPVISAD